MNSKFWVLSSLILFNFGCAQNSMVAKTDMPEDDVVATAPAVDAPKAQQNSRMPASVTEEGKSCQDDLKKENCK